MAPGSIDAVDDRGGHPGRVADGQAVGRVQHLLERARRIAHVRGQRVCDLGAAVSEFGACPTGLDDRHPDSEGATS